ncbi:obscurin-like [Fundulus heteroclitus]|uniref:obscurin-like n=1 Tax=Fundulus heteroclitus TaxID=8078 RepID=UPI00165C57FB|nr:obscurin-like [Fundulus heteroclitus]
MGRGELQPNKGERLDAGDGNSQKHAAALTTQGVKPIRSAGWKFDWFRQESVSSPAQLIRTNEPDGVLRVSEGGVYSCRGGRGDPAFYTETSTKVTIVSTPTVTLQPSWSEIFRGETVTLRCEIQGGGGAQWTYEWSPANRKSSSSSEYRINTATESYSGDYYCRARRGSEQTGWSSAFRLPVLSYKPTATLTADKTVLPTGGGVELRCSVSSSAGWKFDWFRQESVSSPAQLIRTNEPDGVLRVSEGGVYSCRGGRGDPAFYTETSTKVTIAKPQPVLSVSPSWLSPGASVTLSCGGFQHPSAGWRFFWYKAVPEPSSSFYSFDLMPGSTNGTEQNSYLINGQNHTAGYVCRAGRGEPVIYTDYSQPKFVWSTGQFLLFFQGELGFHFGFYLTICIAGE